MASSAGKGKINKHEHVFAEKPQSVSLAFIRSAISNPATFPKTQLNAAVNCLKYLQSIMVLSHHRHLEDSRSDQALILNDASWRGAAAMTPGASQNTHASR